MKGHTKRVGRGASAGGNLRPLMTRVRKPEDLAEAGTRCAAAGFWLCSRIFAPIAVKVGLHLELAGAGTRSYFDADVQARADDHRAALPRPQVPYTGSFATVERKMRETVRPQLGSGTRRVRRDALCCSY